MLYESTVNLIDRCANAKERYFGYYSSSVVMLRNNFSGWHDDVGKEANSSLKTLSDCWYDTVKDGFGCVYDGAQAVKSACAVLKSVKQEEQRAVSELNAVEAKIK